MARWTADAMADQAGRLALVTGANTGIGYEAALQLARKGAQVLLGCRDEQRANQAIERIQAEAPRGSVEWLPLDLADLASVAAAAAQLRAAHQRLDLLICNAGVMVPPAGRTVDGFELQFGINHLGHFALVLQMLPLLQAATAARVVAVSSGAALFGRMVFDDLNFERRGYQPWAAYGQSKLANLLFIEALARRLKRAGSSVVACAAHPGVTATELQRHSPNMQNMPAWLAMPAPQGALPSLRAATDPAVEPLDYFGPDGLLQMRGYPKRVPWPSGAKQQAIADQLWEQSLRSCDLADPLVMATP
jgi:NAD(P)-dependent dehydrogenase (short-subunit alcohol dehydrogenase family)